MAVGLTLVKSFDYRGLNEEWSNKYHFTGADPANDTAWAALAAALIVEERKLYGGDHGVVRAYGYTDDSSTANSVWQMSQTRAAGAGSLSPITQPAPGDAANWIRWTTARFTSKGRRIYLRKYYHGVNLGASLKDSVNTAQLTALAAFGLKMRDGTFLDARTLRAAGQTSETLSGHATNTYVGYRQLRRGTRRPG